MTHIFPPISDPHPKLGHPYMSSTNLQRMVSETQPLKHPPSSQGRSAREVDMFGGFVLLDAFGDA